MSNLEKKTTHIGAVITAAGMSSRVGQFKPLLNIGPLSIVKRIIKTLEQAGVEEIVIIVGHNKEALKKHLKGSNIVFLYNENYANSQMFDSAKIGLAYLINRCDKILFTPVDIPLFKTTTVNALLNSRAKLARPVYEGKSGHPILMSNSIAKKILMDNGENGMRGAISRVSEEIRDIIVNDEGILLDVDTEKDYLKILDYYEKHFEYREKEFI